MAFYRRRPNLHGGPTRLQQGRRGASLVLFPYPAQKTQTRLHRSSCSFVFQNEFTPPPKGGGAGHRLFGLSGFSPREARCFSAEKDGYFVSEGFSRQLPLATAGHNWLTRAQQGGFAASVASFPYPALITAHRAAQGRIWFHRLFLVCFFCGSPASWRSRW